MAIFFISLWNSRVHCNLDWNVFVFSGELHFLSWPLTFNDFLSSFDLFHVGNVNPQMSVNSDVNGSDEGRAIQIKKE